MKSIKNLSMKSARPARSANENQKQTMIFTTSSTEGDMYNDNLSRLCLKIV